MTDLHSDIEVGQSYAAVVEAMANHLADIAFFGPVTFLQAKERAGPSWRSCSACRWPSRAPKFEIIGRTRHFVNAFGENVLDATFGPQVVFSNVAKGMKTNRPPTAGLQSFGTVRIESATEAMTLALHGLDGSPLHRVTLHPEPQE